MDYMKQPLLFKGRKAARYVRLYGPARTLVKVRSEYHMNRHYTHLPPVHERGNNISHVGIIGSGKFGYGTIGYFLTKNYGAVIRGVMDVDVHRAASLATKYGADYYTSDPRRVLEDPKIDLVYVASNHASHVPYACAALAAGKAVHVEKPHAVTLDQLRELCTAMEAHEPRLRLGFNRPASVFGEQIARSLAKETGPGMYNWFVAGHELPADHWYYQDAEGGRVLGNLCHWTDFVFQLVPEDRRFPIEIVPVRAAQSDCDIAVSYLFGDGTIAVITFSAKGHAFEGVKERFAAQRGNVLLAMDDFKTLTIDVREKRRRFRQRFRDHGHEHGICASYEMTRGAPGVSVGYVWETGELVLRTKEALERQTSVTIDQGFVVEKLLAPAA